MKANMLTANKVKRIKNSRFGRVIVARWGIDEFAARHVDVAKKTLKSAAAVPLEAPRSRSTRSSCRRVPQSWSDLDWARVVEEAHEVLVGERRWSGDLAYPLVESVLGFAPEEGADRERGCRKATVPGETPNEGVTKVDAGHLWCKRVLAWPHRCA